MQREIIRYKLFRDSAAVDLSAKVNEYLKEGWQPYGSPSTMVYEINPYEGNELVFCQAMVKYKETECSEK